MSYDPEIPSPFLSFPGFSTLSPEELDEAASFFEEKIFPAGKDLFRTGERARYLYLILAGRVALGKQTRKGFKKAHLLQAGDFLGEEAVLGRRARTATAKIENELTVLRADLAQLRALRRRLPGLYSLLQAIARSRRFADRNRYPWLQEEETIFLATRKSNYLLVPGLLLPIALGIASVVGAIVIFAYHYSAYFYALPALGGILAIAVGIWQTIDWGNDLYFVTNRRVISIQRVPLFYDDRREVPLPSIQSVTFSSTVTQRAFGFGDVTVRTFSRPVILQSIPRPERSARLIEELWNREREAHKRDSRNEIAEVLRNRLSKQDEDDPQGEKAGTPALRNAQGKIPKFAGPLQIRLESGNTITYRKHIFFLVRDTFLPALLFISGLNLAAFAVIGIFPIDRVLGCAIGAAVLLIGAAWIVYEYIDWSNDLFQVTPDQIYSMHRTPLGDEERRGASLDNILSLEYDRPSLLARLFNFGKVTATVGQTVFEFEELQDPVGVQEDIFRRMDQRRLAREQRQRRERREELADWIETYHEMTASDIEDDEDDNADT